MNIKVAALTVSEKSINTIVSYNGDIRNEIKKREKYAVSLSATKIPVFKVARPYIKPVKTRFFSGFLELNIIICISRK